MSLQDSSKYFFTSSFIWSFRSQRSKLPRVRCKNTTLYHPSEKQPDAYRDVPVRDALPFLKRRVPWYRTIL